MPPQSELERMKTQRNHPVSCKRAEILAGLTFAKTDIASGLLNEDLGVSRQHCLPPRLRSLRSDEIREVGQRIEKADRSVRCKIGRKEAKMKVWLSARALGERFVQPLLVRAAPINAVMKERHRRMKFADDPFIVTGRDRRNRAG